MLTTTHVGADRVAQSLAASGIDTRRWWSDGAHAHPATAAYPRSSLPVTEELAQTAIGVPLYRDLAAGDIQRVADALLSVSEVTSDERSGPVTDPSATRV
jgi:dTDP-4-amino-4,6-dideoxygalactose transaminase